MRPQIIAALLTGLAVAGASEATAQSAYEYRYCAIYTNRSGATACYYNSLETCRATMSGIGGYCIESPYYRGPKSEPRRYRRRD